MLLPQDSRVTAALSRSLSAGDLRQYVAATDDDIRAAFTESSVIGNVSFTGNERGYSVPIREHEQFFSILDDTEDRLNVCVLPWVSGGNPGRHTGYAIVVNKKAAEAIYRVSDIDYVCDNEDYHNFTLSAIEGVVAIACGHILCGHYASDTELTANIASFFADFETAAEAIMRLQAGAFDHRQYEAERMAIQLAGETAVMAALTHEAVTSTSVITRMHVFNRLKSHHDDIARGAYTNVPFNDSLYIDCDI